MLYTGRHIINIITDATTFRKKKINTNRINW
jgi:hypothetical protein